MGRLLRRVPVGRWRGHRIDDEDDDSARKVKWCRLPSRSQRLERFEIVEYAAQTQIVGQASIHQMEKRVFDRVIELPQLLQALQDAPSWPRRFSRLGKLPEPGRFPIATRAAVVVDGDRRQDHRYRRRSG